MAQTLEEIRRQGLQALRKELGRSGMLRFLQQFEVGNGDYAQERHAWVDATSLDQLRTAPDQASEEAMKVIYDKGRFTRYNRRWRIGE